MNAKLATAKFEQKEKNYFQQSLVSGGQVIY